MANIRYMTHITQDNKKSISNILLCKYLTKYKEKLLIVVCIVISLTRLCLQQ